MDRRGIPKSQQPAVVNRNGVKYLQLEDGSRVRMPPKVVMTKDDQFQHSGSFSSDPKANVFVAKRVGEDILATRDKILEKLILKVTGGRVPNADEFNRMLRLVTIPPQLEMSWFYWGEVPIFVATPPATRIEGYHTAPMYVARWEGKILLGPQEN